jgi:hypothetical protein
MILGCFQTNAKLGLIVDATRKTIINNGRQLDAIEWLSLKRIMARDLCIGNDYTEFLLEENQIARLGRQLSAWLES